ncbi:hypothetical protein V6N11_072452 [Hibiscus sabdariffa]|uniref:Uncharacterized protein n=1 Tax=Hibiscus sabdariffa TaxID=183260 RepID=A0ABR2U3E2_9ROSI
MEPSDVVYKCSGLVSFGGEVTKVHNVPLECINTKNVAKIEKLVPSFGHAEKECWYDFAHYTRAGIYGKWLTASTTWIKHYENKGNNIDSHQQKLQRVVAGPGEKKETKIDQGSLEIVAGKVNSTRVASFISRVTMEKTQLTPRVVVGYEKGSNGNLGSTMYPDFSGIMEQVTRANVGHGRIIVMLFVCLAGTSTGIGSSQNLGRESYRALYAYVFIPVFFSCFSGSVFLVFLYAGKLCFMVCLVVFSSQCLTLADDGWGHRVFVYAMCPLGLFPETPVGLYFL